MPNIKKKILFSAYSLDLGGIETALVSLINYLSKTNSYKISLVLEKKQGMFLDQIDKNVQIIEYTPSYSKFKPVAKVKNLCKRLKFFMKYKNKFDFSCCYATYCKMASFTAHIASKNTALWVHNNYYYFFDKDDTKYTDFFNSINAHKFKNVIFVSQEAQKQYKDKYGLDNENVLVCNNLIDYQKILELSNEPIEIKKDGTITTFVNVGRHDEHQKKLTRLLESAKRLHEDKEKFRIILVGSGQQTDEYKEIVQNYNLSEEIIFVGKTINPYPYFKIADCVIITSDYEGYPVVYNEAKILNRPIITTNVSDSETEIKNKFGVVINNDTENVYMAMKNFIKDGFTIKEKFNPEKYNKEIIQKIENIINEIN